MVTVQSYTKDDDWAVFELRVKDPLAGDIERVHIHVRDVLLDAAGVRICCNSAAYAVGNRRGVVLHFSF